MKTPMKWLPALVAVGLVVAKASTSVLNDATANDSQSAAPLVALATPSPSPAATASNPQPSTGAIPSPQSPSAAVASSAATAAPYPGTIDPIDPCHLIPPPEPPHPSAFTGMMGQAQPLWTGTPPAHFAPPISYGPFLLRPWGDFGPHDSHFLDCPPLPTPPRGSTRQTDPAVISSSSLYHAPAYVASGYHLGQMEGAGAGNAEIQVRLIYVGSGRPIFVEFTRLRVTQIEKYLPGDSSVAGLDQTQINGSPALISWQTQRSHPSNLEVIFVRDRLVVDINAENVDLDVILKMAQSIP